MFFDVRRVLGFAVLVAATCSVGCAASTEDDGDDEKVGSTEEAFTGVKDCNTLVFPPEPNLQISSVRNMTCKAAKTVARRPRRGSGNKFNVEGGWRCEVVSSQYGGLVSQTRCTKGDQAFRMDYAD